MATVFLALALNGCGADVDTSSDQVADPSVTAESPPPTGGTVATTATTATVTIEPQAIDESMKIQLPEPDWLAADDHFVYTRLDQSHVLRFDSTTGETLGTTDIGGLPCNGLGAAFGSVWACVASDDETEDVVRIDPSIDSVIATIEVDKAVMQGSLVGGFDRVWVLVAGGAQLVGIDPDTNTVDPPIELGAVGFDVAVGVDALWVISNRDDAVLRVDPTTRTVTGRVDGINDPTEVDATADVWVGTVKTTVRIDPTTLEVTTTLPMGAGFGGAVVVDGTDLWIRSADRFLVRVDTTTGAIVEEFDAGVDSGGDAIVAFDAIWATAYDDKLLVRQPLSPLDG